MLGNNSILRSPAHLDILEVDLRVLAEVDYGAEKVEDTLIALEALKRLDEVLCVELLVVLGGDLDHDMQVLSDVRGKTLKEVFNGQGAKIVEQPLRVEQAGEYDNTLKG